MGAALRVTAGSVCGSDLRPYRGAGQVDHAAMGHDYPGEVMKLGFAVTGCPWAATSSAPPWPRASVGDRPGRLPVAQRAGRREGLGGRAGRARPHSMPSGTLVRIPGGACSRTRSGASRSAGSTPARRSTRPCRWSVRTDARAPRPGGAGDHVLTVDLHTKARSVWTGPSSFRGGKGIRTPDLLHAMQTRYQLRHTPRWVVTPFPADRPEHLNRIPGLRQPRKPAGRRRWTAATPRPSVQETPPCPPASPGGPACPALTHRSAPP